MPTYKSTGTDEVVLIDRDNAGNQRVLRAVNNGGTNTSRGQWRCHIEEPTAGGGVVQKQCGTVYGGRGEAAAGLADLMHRTEMDWKQSRTRGFRPAAGIRDHNVSVDETGRPMGSPVISNR